jgi:RHS repeat-associated protein
LRRPLRISVTNADPAAPGGTSVTERFIYGEQCPSGDALNLLGKPWRHFDQAGLATVESMDFKGNPTGASRRVALDYKRVIDWSAVDGAVPVDISTPLVAATLDAAVAPLLDADSWLAQTTFDALNRPILTVSPHTPARPANQLRHTFDVLGHLATVDVNLRGATAGGQPVWTPFVTRMGYDAKGQRLAIAYGNGTNTAYSYDPLTFRLTSLVTSRNAAAFPGDSAAVAGWPGSQVQNLAYAYDPVGNITRITDAAQQTIYFSNNRVDPSNDYTYDALYRLILASGREHLGQAGARAPYSWNDASNTGLQWSALDRQAMGNYTESYTYDAVGNFLQMRHIGLNPANPGWTQNYIYEEPSQIDGAFVSNRLTATSLDGGTSWDRYSTGGDGYDAHGNMLRMAHLPTMASDYRDQLQNVDLIGGGEAWYVYDSSGERLRKVWEKSPNLIEERIYLGGFEIFRRHLGQIGPNTAILERETLHIMDDRQRIALVETGTLDTKGADKAPAQLIRYQFGNHLGSAVLELDDVSQIISYEEYSAYGSTTYQAVANSVDAPKRYRFSGKERDEGTGLNYHSARYYALWLGRWIATDPAGLVDNLNVYAHTRNNPISMRDITGNQSESFDDRAPVASGPFSGSPLPDVSRSHPTPTSEEVYAEAGEDEFLRTHSIAPGVASALDKTMDSLGPEFKRRVQEAARVVGLDPGLLAAAAIAEPNKGTLGDLRDAYLGTHSHQVGSAVIGLDDIQEEIGTISHNIPAFHSIHMNDTGHDFAPESGPSGGKRVLDIPGDQTLLAFASYLKQQEISVRNTLQRQSGIVGRPIEFDELPVEQRFFMTRLRMNPGHNNKALPVSQRGINPSLSKLARGANLFVNGIISPARRAGNAELGATITTAQGIHLSRVVFGINPFAKASSNSVFDGL